MNTEKNQPRASIIIIAYNDEAHIERAIQSACNQTESNIEIICVDDGSMDSTYERMCQCAARDDRIKTITQPNSGILAARYAGLQQVSGEYTLLIDSDDFLLPDAVRTAYDAADKLGADVLEYGIKLEKSSTDPPSEVVWRYSERYYSQDKPLPEAISGPELINACYADRAMPWNVWNKLYDTALLRRALREYRGERICMCEDMLITLMVLCHAKHYARIDAKLYSHLVGGGMSSTSDSMGSSEHIKRRGIEWLVLKLAREWLNRIAYPQIEITRGMEAFGWEILESTIASLTTRNSRAVLAEYLVQLSQLCKAEEFSDLLSICIERQQALLVQSAKEERQLGVDLRQERERAARLEEDKRRLSEVLGQQRTQIAQLEAQNRNLSVSFETISNSTCWRITKPVRVVLDTVKALPYKGKAYILLAKKAAVILRTQGAKAVFEKYRQRRLRLRKAYNLTGSGRVTRTSFVDDAGEEQEPVIPQEWLDIQRQKPLISIVIAAKRLDVRAPYLKKALASLCAQRYQNLEVIVVADAVDMPFVQELIRSFDAQITLRSVMLECDAQNRWAYWCEGISAASGDLIGFLEQEDTLSPNCLAYVLEAYNESMVKNCELYLIPDESQTKDDETRFKDWKSGAGWHCGGADGLLHFGVFDKRRFLSDQAAFEQWLLSLKPEQIFVAPWVGCREAAIENLWGDNSVKCLAFYLPQFHEIPENNRWWGEGFTEWVNVRKAEPLYQGHHQPRIPGELGYYNLGGAEGAEIQKKQIALAREYGLAGFCYYYYWFDGGKRLLEMPLDRHLHDKTMDFPFCLCWANENWTRQWDGQQSEILMPQTYQPGWAEQFILDLLPYLKDERYIRVNGAPFLLIYNLQDIPNPSEAINTWRAVAEQNGIERLHISAVRRTMESGELELSGHSLDSLTDFPPHLLGLVNIDHDEDVRFRLPHGQVKDYRKAASFCAEMPKQNYTYFRTAMLEWDNTARRGKKAYIFEDFSMKEYQKWLYAAKRYTLRQNRPGEDLVFINAWNEWAEGTYLEPSEPWGRAALDATKEVLERR